MLQKCSNVVLNDRLRYFVQNQILVYALNIAEAQPNWQLGSAGDKNPQLTLVKVFASDKR